MGGGLLIAIGLVAFVLAVVLALIDRPVELVLGFLAAGVLLLRIGVFARRMRGPSKLGSGVESDLAPDIAFQGSAASDVPALPTTDPSTLVARWPTLAAALEDIPSDWTRTRIRHDDGQNYEHVRTPQGGFDLVINTAALDSAAPKWLMAAISAMQE